VAGATETPTIGLWTGRSPVRSYDLCANVTHLVPAHWRLLDPCDHAATAQFFTDHYAYREYDDLGQALIGTTLELLESKYRNAFR
jgi:hypothetical protein